MIQTGSGRQQVSVAQFHADVEACAASLPEQRFAINLCRDRYGFSVSLFAAALRGQISLLPSQRNAAAIDLLRASHDGAVVIGDADEANLDHRVDVRPGQAGVLPSPDLPLDQVIAIAFTSGSTGAPQPHPKTWRMFSAWRHWHRRYLPGDPDQPRHLLATVPSSHMFGLEWALLLPTVAPITVQCGQDFYPNDISRMLTASSASTVLVSTPVHLRALLKGASTLPKVDVVVSATAPLDSEFASQLERELACEVLEIYGCSEVGSLARRATARESAWRFFAGFNTRLQSGRMSVTAEEMAGAVELADQFEAVGQDGFELVGRTSDVVKVGGKRESLSRLNLLLQSLPGVEDGVFYEPGALGLEETGRLGALVVAPGATKDAIRAELSEQVDPAFMPRPLRLVPSLPRTETSKLTRTALKELVVANV